MKPVSMMGRDVYFNSVTPRGACRGYVGPGDRDVLRPGDGSPGRPGEAGHGEGPGCGRDGLRNVLVDRPVPDPVDGARDGGGVVCVRHGGGRGLQDDGHRGCVGGGRRIRAVRRLVGDGDLAVLEVAASQVRFGNAVQGPGYGNDGRLEDRPGGACNGLGRCDCMPRGGYCPCACHS
jgi:hypothetical protein